MSNVPGKLQADLSPYPSKQYGNKIKYNTPSL